MAFCACVFVGAIVFFLHYDYDYTYDEDEFIEKHFEDVRNSSMSKGMDDKAIKTWLKVSYKTGVSEVNELVLECATGLSALFTSLLTDVLINCNPSLFRRFAIYQNAC